MTDKSPRKTASKKSGKSLKEKRAAKKAKEKTEGGDTEKKDPVGPLRHRPTARRPQRSGRPAQGDDGHGMHVVG